MIIKLFSMKMACLVSVLMPYIRTFCARTTACKVLRVRKSLCKFQREFLDKGLAYLKPLVLKDVADDIGMHESTVSRVTTNKYVHTPQGIFELKYFFNTSIQSVDGGDGFAAESVKEKIRQLIAAEDAEPSP